MSWRCFIGWLLAGVSLLAQDPAAQMYWQARDAEKKGDVVRAYLLYAQAAAMNPKDKEAWARAQALRTRAAMKAAPMPIELMSAADDPDTPSDDPTLPPVVTLTPRERAEAQQYKPPAQLALPAGLRNFQLRGQSRPLWEQAGRELGIDIVFDREYDNGAPTSLPQTVRLDQVAPRDLLHTLEAVTGSFLVPIGDRLVIVARDTPPKRQELEPNVAVEIPIPETVAIQEAQELSRNVQQTFDLQKVALDAVHRLVYIRGAVSKVRPAQLLAEQLLWHRPQVAIDVEFVDIQKTSSWTAGVTLPTTFSLVDFGRSPGSATSSLPRFLQLASLPAGIAKFLAFGGGATFLGLGVTDGSLFASATEARSQTILKTLVRSVEGQAATLHIGDRYPITTTQYTGTGSNGSSFFGAIPSFTYEDLGLTLKVTPRVHGTDDVSLEIDAEFKVLGGTGTGGIPIISNRKFNSKVRLRQGEWGVIAGLMSTSEARNLSGIVGLMNVPILGPLTRSNGHDKSSGEVLLVLKPHLLSLPPTEMEVKPLYVGTETRLVNPL